MRDNWLHLMDNDGRTPLDRAFQCGHMALPELLLQQERDDETLPLPPLHRAAQLGLTMAVDTLLRCGADPQSRDDQGETPLHKAAREGHVATAKLLCGWSDVNASCNRGLSPLHWASLAGHSTMAALLMTHGADPWMAGAHLDGLSPMAIAQTMQYEELEETVRDRAMSYQAA